MDLQPRLETELGVGVTALRRAGAGNTGALVQFRDGAGHAYIAKTAEGGGVSLEIEGYMLRLLEDGGLPVPRVYLGADDLLVMDDLQPNARGGRDFEAEAGTALARLHRDNEGDMYGLDRDTLIGPLDQPNNRESDWLTFFRDHRLLAFARHARDKGRIDRQLMRNIEALAGKLDSYITRPETPRLLHGDAWAGNILARDGHLAGFIDPAIYYGDPEIELAFVHLMGGKSQDFFDSYYTIMPYREGFNELRRDLYNLYPLLVHTILFGGGYAREVARIVTRLC